MSPNADHPEVYAVLLAAGASRRFGKHNKLLARIDGTPLVRRVAEQLLASRAAGVIVVTGFEAGKVRGALTGLDVSFAGNPDFAEGLASSLKCGVAALGAGVAGAMIVLADMPGTAQALVDQLIAIFEEGSCEKIVYPARGGGAQGNPVIWPARYFAELQTLCGDAGAKQLISQYGDAARPVPLDNEASFGDIDTPGDLEAWREEGG